MLEAHKSNWFEKIFAVYNKNLIKRRFSSLKVFNIDSLLYKKQTLPLIIYVNHSSWWDGLTAFQLSYKAKLDSFIMMEEQHLRRFYLFRRLGAFSIEKEKPRKALKSLEYSAALLKNEPERTLWIFPQGEILPNDTRPLKFYNGLSRIIATAGKCFVLPLAVRYEFTGEFKPEIFVKIGEAEVISGGEDFNIKEMTKYFADKLTLTLDELKTDVINNDLTKYRNII